MYLCPGSRPKPKDIEVETVNPHTSEAGTNLEWI